MNELSIYFILAAVAVVSILNKKTSKQIYKRTEILQEELDKYIMNIKSHNVK